MDNRRIFEFLTARLNGGQPCALVTVIAVDGSSMRGPGAHMAVCADGSFTGSLSGGCIENAVVAEALAAIAAGRTRITRFGNGSRFIDIKLPCGGGLDIHFLPLHDTDFAGQCADATARRRPFSMILPRDDGVAEYRDGWHRPHAIAGEAPIIIGHHPAPRLLIIGHGSAAECLHQQAKGMDLDVRLLTPDMALADRLSGANDDIILLRSVRDIRGLQSDAWSAIVFLFHDHDWEGHLMAHALAQPHFYIGAMGGRKAHAARCDSLRALGVGDDKIADIHAPIGLFHSSRDPASLALSALAEIVQCYQSYDFAAAQY